MTYGEIYEELMSVLDYKDVSDYRPGPYVNSIFVWLNNGGQIIYISKEGRIDYDPTVLRYLQKENNF